MTMFTDDAPSPALRLSVTPEPSDEELAAIVVALLHLTRRPETLPELPSVSRWARAGRIAAMRGLERSQPGWVVSTGRSA